jgi:Spy/CpxP family protein refolding chaperone
MNKSWQICLVLTAIFVAGGLSGGLVAFRWARQHLARPPAPDVWVPRQFERFARQLELTPEQRQRIQPIL